MVYAILAAGIGSRLSEEGFVGSKPMVTINGSYMIDRLVNIFTKNKASNIYIIINEHSLDLEVHLNRLAEQAPIIVIKKNTQSSLHSFGALLDYLPDVDKICLTTTDTIFDTKEFKNYIDNFNSDTTIDGLLAVTPHIDDESPLYVTFDTSRKINQITDEPADLDLFVSGGIYCFRKKALSILPEAIKNGMERMRNFQRFLLKENLTLKAYSFHKIIDVDHMQDIEKAQSFLNEIDTKNES